MGNKNVGFATYESFKRIEKMANDLGLKFDRPKHHGYEMDTISLYPIDECLPLYSRDAQVYTGSLGEVDAWLTGVMWARYYDKMLKVSEEKKRERKEQDYRNQQLVKILKQSEKEKR